MQKKRAVHLGGKTNNEGLCVLYVMSRDQRVHDNHALLLAQADAEESKLPLQVVFNFLPQTGVRSQEQYRFMMEGLREVRATLQLLGISFHILVASNSSILGDYLRSANPKSVYFDFNPLRGPRNLQKKIAGIDTFATYVVDTHNVIPLWVLSDKLEFAAHTMRRKVHKNLSEWLEAPRVLKKHLYSKKEESQDDVWQKIEEIVSDIPKSGIKVPSKSGEKAAKEHLRSFITDGLSTYAAERNIPTKNGVSDLSPYLHFGQISSLRVALAVTEKMHEPPLLLQKVQLAGYEGEPTIVDSCNILLEELIVRKELADNYCFYNDSYDEIDGAWQWAQDTLKEHATDVREFIYTLDQLKNASTHDAAWNAAQRQMMATGKMHGYMRMYWAKKILEWSHDPREALKHCIYLNDHYSIDGGDPNGYTGIMWSIAGVHDRPWFDRPIYGKIRYMNESGLKKRFNIEDYVEKWL